MTRAHRRCKGRISCLKLAEAYNVAVIETLDGYFRGAVITICADQAIPADWMLESDDRQQAECPGARARQGTRTAHVIYKM